MHSDTREFHMIETYSFVSGDFPFNLSCFWSLPLSHYIGTFVRQKVFTDCNLDPIMNPWTLLVTSL